MTRKELKHKTKDVLDLLLYKDIEFDDACDHIQVIANKFAKSKCREQVELIISIINEDCEDENSTCKKQLINKLKKIPLAE